MFERNIFFKKKFSIMVRIPSFQYFGSNIQIHLEFVENLDIPPKLLIYSVLSDIKKIGWENHLDE